jgi:MFS family permease
LRVPGFARLYAGLLLGRAGGSMWLLILVLFALQRYHSPQLAGIVAFLSIVPGLLLAPVAGALLDRHGRAKLVVADYLIAAFACALIGGLSASHLLQQPLLLVIVGLASLTNPLSIAGARTLFPVIAPREMWERANALDSSGHVIASLVASPLAGVLVGLVGGEWALAVAAAIFAVAALVMLRLPDPSPGSQGSILRNAWLGLRYVVHNATLRGIAITMFIFNLGTGALTITLPVLVLDRLHQGPATVGILLGIEAVAGLGAALVFGRLKTEGKERLLMFGGLVVSTVAIALLPLASSLPLVVVSVVLFGLALGPFDIGLFTIRQRRVDPAWFGRAFAVSMAINYIGTPIGSALAGPVIASSLNLALWASVAICAVSTLLPLLVIPARDDRLPNEV